ncbi:hypothetical protein CLW00_111115 [Mongoliibacter ruber]|uniref:Uncharacterized protein n=1 Tax=Mongoliibacter ruber TaxID=1750599 RepID=A0A2T0WGH4_9BACT|nr:hypothetical protein CLW00_111115 [Mongoliibacter ruber]
MKTFTLFFKKSAPYIAFCSFSLGPFFLHNKEVNGFLKSTFSLSKYLILLALFKNNSLGAGFSGICPE